MEQGGETPKGEVIFGAFGLPVFDAAQDEVEELVLQNLGLVKRDVETRRIVQVHDPSDDPPLNPFAEKYYATLRAKIDELRQL